MIELSEALTGSGELSEAQTVLDEATTAAEAAGDPRMHVRAKLESAFTELHTWDGPLEAFLPLSDEAAAIFEDAADDAGLSRALMLRAYITFIRCQMAETEEIVDRALAHAERGDNRRFVPELLHVRARAALRGPTRVDEAIDWCEGVRDENPGDQGLDAFLRGELAVLEAMRGRFDDARELAVAAQRIFLDLGRTLALAAVQADVGAVELLAGEPAAAAHCFRSACNTMEDIGERGNLSTYAGLLAHALVEQGSEAEADRYARLSEETALHKDVQSQVLWRLARSQLLCRAGDVAEARHLSEEAVGFAEQTDDLNLIGDAVKHVGLTLATAGDAAGAAAAFSRAQALYEQKGNVTSAAHAESLARDPVVKT